ncbi:MAG: hypothetical protein L3J02_01360 [Henriciella sp.]|nr:hypothetical protein [Henriciella sp.]
MTEPAPLGAAARSPEEFAAQKKRNIWLAFALVAFVALVGITSAIRISNSDFSKTGGFYLKASPDKGGASSADE